MIDSQGNLSAPGAFIGKTTREIVYMWNQEHPEDMIVFAAEPEPRH